MALSYDEMQQLFEQIGFKGFSMRPYDAKMENLLSTEPEDNAKAYAIDVVPGGLADGLNDGIALLEKHYYKKANMDKLYEKWLEIVLHFSCYYPLKSVFVTGLALPDDEEFMAKTPNEDGYYLEFPLESIDDLDMLSELASQKTYGSLTFWFSSLDTGLWQKPISLSGKLPHLRKTICMTRPCSALRSVWASMMMRVIIRQFTPHFLTLTATALTTN